MSDLERAFDALKLKATQYGIAFSYAEGNQPLQYSTQRLHDAFRDLNATFSQNWVSVVIDSVLDRLSFQGWSVKEDVTNEMFATIFEEYQISSESHSVHRSALITHEAFIIAWKEDEAIQCYYNDPRLCHVFYNAENPRLVDYAAKWYKADNRYYITLYYPDRLEYYETAEVKSTPAKATAFKPSEVPTADNPYGVIPVFHFMLDKHSNNSELTNIVTLQDAVNKLFADMMVAAEFGAYKQRYVISNLDASNLKNKPNEIWLLPAGDGVGQGTSVGEFQETPLSNYLDAIDKIASSIAIISRTPKHYFYQSGSDISGEALMAMEAPLVAKVERYQESFEVTWKALGSFLAKLQGVAVPAKDIDIIWNPPQSVQPKTEADVMKVLKEVGIPLDIVLKWAGKTETEIKEISGVLNKEKEESRTQAQLMLERLRLQNAQSNEVVPQNQTLTEQNE